MKKRYGAALLLVLCVVLLAACAKTSQTSMGQMKRDQTKTSMSQMNTNMGQADMSPTSTDQAKTSTIQAAKVQITLSDFHITSSIMTFTAGIPYHFTVTNQGKTTHELMLMSTTMKTMDMSGMLMKNMDQMALVSLAAMKPGTTKTFDYTFQLATAGTHPQFACHLPGHYEAGMALDVRVQAA